MSVRLPNATNLRSNSTRPLDQAAPAATPVVTTPPGVQPAAPRLPDLPAIKVDHFSTPGSGIIHVDPTPTAWAGNFASIQKDLTPGLDLRHALRGFHVDPPAAQRALKTLLALDGDAFPFMLRRMLFERHGAMLNTLFGVLARDPDRSHLQALMTAVATRLPDGFTARALLERLEPEALIVLSQARKELPADTRAALDATLGGDATHGWSRVEDAVYARKVTAELVDTLGPAAAPRSRRAVGSAADQLLAVSPEARLDGVLRGLASVDGGAQLNALLTRLASVDGSKLKALVDRAARVLTPATRTALLDVLQAPALLLVSAAMGPDRAKAIQQAALLQDGPRVQRAAAQVTQETAQVLTGHIAPTPEDQAWLSTTMDAAKSQDRARIVEQLEAGGPRRFAMLWANRAALTAVGPPVDTWLTTLQTRPGQAWDVRWMFTSDQEASVIRGLFSQLEGPLNVLQPLKPVLAHVRKEFGPVQHAGTPQAALEGGTTFGFTPGKDGSGAFTTNVIRMAQVDGAPAAVMTYVEKGTPFAPFQDAFVVLAPDVVLAAGRTGVNLGGGKLAGVNTNPFYMVRVDRETGQP